ncbi:hypothetical protein GCM10019016_138520 [Streptomyces prasinosporus]|uniref:Uncharacterized protein n=1 Tax=Streptomyces prasinosporus TaxID=68256 RepID=A0ABP6UG33_9ACTN
MRRAHGAPPAVGRAFSGAAATAGPGRSGPAAPALGIGLPAVVRSVAADAGVPPIDLTARTKALVESLGVEGSKALYLSDEERDDTHTSVHGATVYAGLVRDELVGLRLVPEGRVGVR